MKALRRAASFCEGHGLRAPILMAPMAGACPPSLASAVAGAGGLGACGAVNMGPSQIRLWVDEFRQLSGGSGRLALNLWAPDPAPLRDEATEARIRAFLERWGPPLDARAGDAALPQDFEAQCEAILEVKPNAISSIMGLFPPHIVQRAHAAGIPWFATVTTATEARAAAAAGCSALIAQGSEAGGHSGCFDAARGQAERCAVGLMSLIPAVCDAAPGLPVIGTGGITDARGVAAALILGASAVQVGTGLLRTPECGIPAAWSAAVASAQPEDTITTRAYTGRLARGVGNVYLDEAHGPAAPMAAPFPVQRGLTAPMRADAAHGAGDGARMQAWAGQSARLAEARPAGDVVADMWLRAQELLRSKE